MAADDRIHPVGALASTPTRTKLGEVPQLACDRSHAERLVDLRRPSARREVAVEQGTRELQVVLAENEQRAAELEARALPPHALPVDEEEALDRIENVVRLEVPVGGHPVGARLPCGGDPARDLQNARKCVVKVRVPVEPLFSGGFEPGVPGRPLEQAEPVARRCEVGIVVAGVVECRQRQPEPGRQPRIDLRVS